MILPDTPHRCSAILPTVIMSLPQPILTMTCTVAATKDMKSRFAAFFGEAAAGNKIILSTVHYGKGLEYGCVYLADMIDGILPPKAANEVHTIKHGRMKNTEIFRGR